MINRQRIGIIGGPGSGKSCFANKLGKQLGVMPIELDKLRWGKEWLEVPREKTRSEIMNVLNSSSCILDGNFISFGSDLLDHVDLVVWLDLPVEQCLGRVILRSIQELLSGEELHNGNVQTLPSMCNIIQKCIAKHEELRATMPNLLKSSNLLRLRSAEAVQHVLCSFPNRQLVG